MLHALNLDGWEKTAWCAPCAVAMLTGAPVLHMHQRAAFHLDVALKDVKGLHTGNSILLLREQGYKVQRVPLEERFDKPPTLQKFFAEGRTPYEFCMPMLVIVPEHALTCHMGYAGDNWTKRPVPVSEFPKLKRRVVAAYVVMKDRS